MRPDDWHLTEDLDDFLAEAGDFLRSRPALHTQQLTVTEKLRTRGPAEHGSRATLFGRQERAGQVEATFYRLPSRGLAPTALTPDQADTLAARLSDLGHELRSGTSTTLHDPVGSPIGEH
ncbi:hypothetical protein ACUXZZ_21300 [Streptomyces graminifolii]|uniref:hypothetical protein n=1 Tax=Streptomyces graminifolii TaxID=1266771 RepID=UPI0040586759